ncbi:MAG: thiamine pyrophosphate-dependent enzyme [Acidimicrobiales bacterium]
MRATSSPSTLERLRSLPAPSDTIVASGVGQHQMWTSQYQFNHPYTWVNSGGLGTMGFFHPRRHRRQGGPS